MLLYKLVDLKKRATLETTQQQTKLFESLLNKPFWIWDVEEHKAEDIKTKGNCWFNHIIGLPRKEGIDRPIFDYQKILYDTSLDLDFYNSLNRNFKNKHVVHVLQYLVLFNFCCITSQVCFSFIKSSHLFSTQLDLALPWCNGMIHLCLFAK